MVELALRKARVIENENGPGILRPQLDRHIAIAFGKDGQSQSGNATEGAAPNRPAKLFGFRTAPNSANTETITLPTMKRKMNCIFKWSVREARSCSKGSGPTQSIAAPM